MEQSRIQDWVKDSKSMDKYSHRELKFLVEKYPYFEVAHLLLLKNLNDNQSIRFKEELRNSALHISDRRQLYLLLNDRLKFLPYQERSDSENIGEKDQVIEPIQVSIADVPNDTEEISNKDELFELSDDVNITDHDENEELIIGQELIKDSEILELTDSENEEVKRKEFKEIDSVSEESDSELLVTGTEVYHIGYGGNLYTLNDDQDQEKAKEETEGGNLSFTDWMNVVDKGEETQTLDDDKKTPSKKKNLDLIDSFIQNEPSIQRNIKVADKQEDISLDSVQENDGFMSETLASIYVKQRLFDKAIAVYRKLELKNPEKNVYFASQIEKIEKLKNSK